MTSGEHGGGVVEDVIDTDLSTCGAGEVIRFPFRSCDEGFGTSGTRSSWACGPATPVAGYGDAPVGDGPQFDVAVVSLRSRRGRGRLDRRRPRRQGPPGLHGLLGGRYDETRDECPGPWAVRDVGGGASSGPPVVRTDGIGWAHLLFFETDGFTHSLTYAAICP